MLAEVGAEMRLRPRILVALAELRAQQGEFDEGRRLYAEARSIATEYGLQLLGALQTLSAGGIELLADDPAAAEAELRRGYEILRRIGKKISLSTSAAFLAEALYRQGRLDEAERLTEISRENAPTEDMVSQAWLRGTRAKVLARRDEAQQAVELAREAVALAERGDALNLQGDALMNLAEVLEVAGRHDEAASTAERALARYEGKGNVVSARRAAAALAAAR